MKIFIKLLTIVIWALLIYIFIKFNLTSSNLINFFTSSNNYKALTFIILASLRIVLLIPSGAFFIIGIIIFNPTEAFVLNLLSIILSESVIYFTSKVLTESKIHKFIIKKYPRLHEILLKNNIKILALGILCPIAPSDVACFLASSTGLKYKPFIITVILANTPMLILFSLLGFSAMTSTVNAVIVTVMITLASSSSIIVWNRINLKNKLIIKD